MSRNKFPQNAVDTTIKTVEDLKVGDRVESNHPYFAGAGVVDSLPSTDGAVVQLVSGERQYIPMKYLRSSPAQTQALCSSAVEGSSQLVESIAPAAISADNSAVEIAQTLTPEEERERHRLELRVESAFFEAGKALTQLRDQKLYRSTHKTFEAYCQERFGFSRRHPYRLIEAASVFENLCPNGTQNALPTNKRQILPTSERQVRELVSLEPEQQREIWHRAVSVAGGKVPSSRIVKSIVERLKEKPSCYATDFCNVGDVFTLTRLEGEERKYNSYPCVAIELKQFTIDVDVHDTILTVKPENLQKLDFPEVHRQLPQILMRIKRLRQVGTLDRGANHFLAGVGRQVYLTEVEEMLLSCLEAHYKVEDCNDAQATT